MHASGSDTLKVTPTNDAVVEGDETIVVSGSVTGFSVTAATITRWRMMTRRSCRSADPSANVAEGNNATYTVAPVQGDHRAGAGGLVGYGGYCGGG